MLRTPPLGSLRRCDYLVRPDLGLPHRSQLKRLPSGGAFFLTGTLNLPGYSPAMTYPFDTTASWRPLRMVSEIPKRGRIPAKVNFMLTPTRRGKYGPGAVLRAHKDRARPFLWATVSSLLPATPQP